MKTNCVPVQQAGYYVRPQFERQVAEAGPYERIEDLYEAFERGDFQRTPGAIPVARWKTRPDAYELATAEMWEGEARRTWQSKDSRLAESEKLGKICKWASGGVALAAGLSFSIYGAPQALGLALAATAVGWGYVQIETKFARLRASHQQNRDNPPSVQQAASLRQPHWGPLQQLEYEVRLQPPGM